MGDVITLELFDDEEEIDDVDMNEEVDEEDVVEEPPGDSMVLLTVTDHAGNEKPRIHLPEFPLYEVPTEVRKVLHRTVFLISRKFIQ